MLKIWFCEFCLKLSKSKKFSRATIWKWKLFGTTICNKALWNDSLQKKFRMTICWNVVRNDNLQIHCPEYNLQKNAWKTNFQNLQKMTYSNNFPKSLVKDIKVKFVLFTWFFLLIFESNNDHYLYLWRLVFARALSLRTWCSRVHTDLYALCRCHLNLQLHLAWLDSRWGHREDLLQVQGEVLYELFWMSLEKISGKVANFYMVMLSLAEGVVEACPQAVLGLLESTFLKSN